MNDSFLPSLKLQNDLNSSSESQFLGRLIRNPESPRRRKGSGVLKDEIVVWSSQGGEKHKIFFFFFKPRADDCTEKNSSCSRICFCLNTVPMTIQQQCILLEDMFLLLENLLTDPVILKCIYRSGSGKTFLLLVLIPLSKMYIVEVGLVILLKVW